MIYSCRVHFYISVCLMVAVIDIRQKRHVYTCKSLSNDSNCMWRLFVACCLHVYRSYRLICMHTDAPACMQLLPLACSYPRAHAAIPARRCMHAVGRCRTCRSRPATLRPPVQPLLPRLKPRFSASDDHVLMSW